MFNNIGGKIKVLAMVICWTGIILNVCFSIFLFVSGFRVNNTYLLLVSALVLVLGPLFSWIGSFLLYGFGELVESVDKIERKL